jgi:hypothetical protein
MSATGASTFLSERMNRRYFILLFVVAGGGSLQNVLGMVRKKLLSCFVLQFDRISFGTVEPLQVKMMTRAEWIEVLLIGILAPMSWLAWPYFPSPIPLWQIVLGVSILLLLQSLVRDVAILLRTRRSASNEPRKEAQCFCLESTVGVTGVVAGAALVGLDSSTNVTISRWDFFLAVAGTMALSFIIKDLVISWKPLGVRREKDHLNLIVRWKSKTK